MDERRSLDLYSIGSGPREQTVLTPQCIADRLLELWPQGVAYDPCWAPGTLVESLAHTSTRGLLDPWPDRTYCNPPYGSCYVAPADDAELIEAERLERAAAKAEGRKVRKPEGGWAPKANLEDWLGKQLHYWFAYGRDSVMLVPNRTHRRWFRHWRNDVTAVIELDPLTFVGFKAAFPAPLVLGYCGYDAQRFLRAFGDLGDPVPLDGR